MLDFPSSFAAWTAATAVPAFLGLTLVYLFGRLASAKYAAAFALGIFFWFFVDTIQGSSDLLVNVGFTGGIDQVGMVVLFAVGLIGLFLLDCRYAGGILTGSPAGFAVPVLAALAVGVHGFGEGTAFGSTAALTPSTSIINAFGGTSAGTSYALHKMLEPMMVGALYVGLKNGKEATGRNAFRDILVLTTLFVLPSLLGAATGYYVSYDSTYFFGLGTGTSIYAAIRLGKQALEGNGTSGRRDGVWMALVMTAGFILIYLAALMHS
ncbi:MAG TPA: hypothetical protein VFE91_07415 [Nitrososphaerales archaeon]|nr:hypothetical protein [Nitrososphaerales archaeon]